jgi:histidinol-phosphate phosphatase family protein
VAIVGAVRPRGWPVLRQAVILVGGFGSRLGTRTASTPKPLLEVAGRPFLEHLLQDVGRYGVFEEVLLLAGYLGEEVQSRYEGQVRGSARIKVIVEPQPLGTGGALLNAKGALEERFLMLNGDSFFDFNLLDLATAPWPTGLLGRLALLRGEGAARYGRVVLENDRIKEFQPVGGGSGPVNAGVYILDRTIIDLIERVPCSLESDLFAKLAGRGRLDACLYDGFFIDIGVPADLQRADRELGERLRRPAVFFDRDGVLIEDLQYVHRPGQVQWIPAAKDAIKGCNDSGAFVFVVTNQAGVAHGYYDESAVRALHAWMNQELAQVGAHVDAFEYCPHHPDARIERYREVCRRRKPKAGMILDLLERWHVDPKRSFLVGDQMSDIEAAHTAGMESVLFKGGNLHHAIKQLLHGVTARDGTELNENNNLSQHPGEPR